MLTLQGGDSLVGGLPIIHITYQQYIANPSAYQDPDVIVHISGFPTAGNMPADYVGYDSNLNMEDIGNIATKAIAKVEPSDTALYLHNVGEYFINKDGDACKVDLQIPVNGTITLGTNCHVLSKGVANDINSNLTTGYNQYYQDISLPYTALKDELLTLSFSKTGENTVYFKVNTVDVCSIYARVGYNVVTIPLKKGDVLTASETFTNLKASIFVLLNN